MLDAGTKDANECECEWEDARRIVTITKAWSETCDYMQPELLLRACTVSLRDGWLIWL